MPPRARLPRPALVLVAVPSTAPDAAARRALAVRELLAQAGMLEGEGGSAQPQAAPPASMAPKGGTPTRRRARQDG